MRGIRKWNSLAMIAGFQLHRKVGSKMPRNVSRLGMPLIQRRLFVGTNLTAAILFTFFVGVNGAEPERMIISSGGVRLDLGDIQRGALIYPESILKMVPEIISLVNSSHNDHDDADIALKIQAFSSEINHISHAAVAELFFLVRPIYPKQQDCQ